MARFLRSLDLARKGGSDVSQLATNARYLATRFFVAQPELATGTPVRSSRGKLAVCRRDFLIDVRSSLDADGVRIVLARSPQSSC